MQEELYYQIVKVCELFKTGNLDLAHDVYLKINPDKIEGKTHNESCAYIYFIARSIHLDNKRRDKKIKFTDQNLNFPDQIFDNYKDNDYFRMLNEAPLTEIQRIQVECYLDSDGQYSEMSRKINRSRQTLSKKIKEICQVLKQYHSGLD